MEAVDGGAGVAQAVAELDVEADPRLPLVAAFDHRVVEVDRPGEARRRCRCISAVRSQTATSSPRWL